MPDIIVECIRATSIITDGVTRSAPPCVVCLAAISSDRHTIGADLSDANRRMVLDSEFLDFEAVS